MHAWCNHKCYGICVMMFVVTMEAPDFSQKVIEWMQNTGLTLNEIRASDTALSMNSSLILREGCSLNTEFISAIFAVLLLASAFVGQS